MTPTPDLPPHSGHAPIVYVAYDYETPAKSKVTGQRIPHYWFLCHVPVHGARKCVMFRR